MERQEFYRRAYHRRRQGWRASLALYQQVVDAIIAPDSPVLDLGCGHADLLASAFAKTPHTYGIDPDLDALHQNPVVRHRVSGVGERLPFPDQCFDVVTAAWVVEHLADPALVAREVLRMLGPGGRFVFLTPNALHPATWLIRLVPNRLHARLARWVDGRQERSTFPVRYRMNTPQAIGRILRWHGFAREALLLNVDPSYLISVDPVTFRLGCTLEALIDRRWSVAEVHIIGTYTRPRQGRPCGCRERSNVR
jgi:SAM-dependent methyltransferase